MSGQSLHVQLGGLSNHLSAHFWSLQSELIDNPKDVNSYPHSAGSHDTEVNKYDTTSLFTAREQSYGMRAKYVPKSIHVDLNENLSQSMALSVEMNEYDIKPSWSGETTAYNRMNFSSASS